MATDGQATAIAWTVIVFLQTVFWLTVLFVILGQMRQYRLRKKIRWIQAELSRYS